MKKDKTFVFAANVTYAGVTQNLKVRAEYTHTGQRYVLKRPNKAEKYTTNKEIGEEYVKKYAGRQTVKITSGYYYINRLAIETTTADGEKKWWYINNPGDAYRINKVSKRWDAVHAKLSEETILKTL